MKNKPVHTPTPWKVREYKYGKDYTGVIEAMDGIYLGEMSCTMGQTKKEDQTPIANAAYIVRAVNSYEDMLHALKRFVYFADSESRNNPELRAYMETIAGQAMREAISKAEVK